MLCSLLGLHAMSSHCAPCQEPMKTHARKHTLACIFMGSCPHTWSHGYMHGTPCIPYMVYHVYHVYYTWYYHVYHAWYTWCTMHGIYGILSLLCVPLYTACIHAPCIIHAWCMDNAWYYINILYKHAGDYIQLPAIISRYVPITLNCYVWVPTAQL